VMRRTRRFRAPGRVNLIGEHTDYSGGFVMPMAIQLATTVSLTPRADQILVLHAEGFAETAPIDLVRPLYRTGSWSDYIAGVAKMLVAEGWRPQGADLSITSTVPHGAGLSSSAALEVAAGFALLTTAGESIDRKQLARLCQRAENEFVGARCGIMDQYIACCGEPEHALMIDCRSLESRLIRIPNGAAIVVLNTMVKHANASGEYNARRVDCEKAVEGLSRRLPHVRTLRDASLGDLSTPDTHLESRLLRRARHVVSENRRVLAAVDALDCGDLTRFGSLMTESHESLRDDYEVSCAELDVMVRLAGSEAGQLGTRMTGGGFGGCTVSLVKATAAESFTRSMQRRYSEATGIRSDGWICVPSGGVHEVRGEP
jgi:galactokinase